MAATSNYIGSAGLQPTEPASIPAPAVPTGLAVDFVTASRVRMVWDFVSTATKFDLERATVSGGPFTSLSATITALFFIDTTVSANTTFFYRVKAINGSGPSAFSAEVSTTTLASDLPIIDRAETDLSTLIPGMAIAGGFNFDWSSTFNRRDLAKTATYPSVTELDWEPEETNIDDEEGAHSNAYSNIVTMRLLAVGKLTTVPTNPKDSIRVVTTKMLDDLKKLFGVNFQLNADTGIYSIMYKNSTRLDHGSGDVLKAFHLETFWNIRYIQSRTVPAEAG